MLKKAYFLCRFLELLKLSELYGDYNERFSYLRYLKGVRNCIPSFCVVFKTYMLIQLHIVQTLFKTRRKHDSYEDIQKNI